MGRSVFHCIDGHTCGNPVRLVVSGGPELKGRNMAEKRLHFLREYDWIRTGLMFEPRGHDMMSGAIFYPPSDPQNDTGILFIETSGCLPMCGHGTIGAVTLGLEHGILKPKDPGLIRLETPAGLISVSYELENDKVAWVKFTNVPAFLAAEDLEINDPELGKLTFDVGYGGNFYAIIDPQENYTGLEGKTAEWLITHSRKLRSAINKKYPGRFVHPEDERISGLSHVLWTGKATVKEATSRNAVFYGDKAIDRSPCGTGTSARMAQWHARGKLKPGDIFVHESIIGSTFEGCVEGLATVGEIQGIIPSIRGWAKAYGKNRITIDTDDPFAHGFQVI